MPRSGYSALHGVNPNEKNTIVSVGHFLQQSQLDLEITENSVGKQQSYPGFIQYIVWGIYHDNDAT